VIDLSLGQPDVPAPKHVSEAMQLALDNPLTSYTSSAGSDELRTLIAQEITRSSGAETTRKEIIVTAGSKHALFITLLSLVDPGEEVLVFEPHFPPYTEILGLVGGRLETVPIVQSGNELRPDVDTFLSTIGSKTKAVLLNYPNNPAGWTLSGDEVKKIVDHCVAKGIFVISDEIYDHIVFDGKQHCPAWTFSEDSDRIIHVGSFSKTYSMVPYRLGFVAARENVASGILKSQRATVTMVSPYVQKAGCAALSGPQDFVKSRLAKYEERRNKCLQMLAKHGVNCPKPSGAFYLFIPLSNSKWNDAFVYASALLDQHKVAVIPGGVFGDRWKNYFRISFATEDTALYEGVEKLSELLARRT
jgi:aspartate aminotransferase